MQRILGFMRKAIQEFNLIQDGDRIAVGVSGGKDSVALLYGLAKLRGILGVTYDIVAITIDPCFNNKETDYSPIEELCHELNVPYILKRSEIGSIVFDQRKEKHPCSLCAKLRRGAIHDLALEAGCNKVALGHHYNDAVETFVMNLFTEGRIGCFTPKNVLSRKGIWLIRPLVLAPEREIRNAVKRTGLPVVKSACPADGHTNREQTKVFLRAMEKESRGFTYRLFGAMRRAGIDGWGYTNQGSTALTPPLTVQHNNIIIRSVLESDAIALAAIYRPYVEKTAITFEYEAPDAEEFANRIIQISKSYPYIVAVQNGKIAGYAYAGKFKERAAYDWCAESSIYIKPDFQHQGIGRMLYEELERRLTIQGILNLNACITVPQNEEDEYANYNSVHFHEHLGFHMVGTFHKCGYKFGRWYNMCWMEKEISNHPDQPAAISDPIR